MPSYILRRFALMIPTLLGIMSVAFIVVQFVPGGPVERMVAQLRGQNADAVANLSGATLPQTSTENAYRGAQGLDPAFIKALEKQYGFDKPWPERYGKMLWDYARFDLGKSYYRDTGVLDLVLEKMPVSISIGLWSTLIIYLVAVPLGIAKAVRQGAPFDLWTSIAVFVGYAVPPFLFAIVLIVLFAGGRYLDWFPLRGLLSENWRDLSFFALIGDYIWHITLPLVAMVAGGFASLTILTKNSFLDELGKPYVLTARAKGLTQTRVLWGHVFRNAMLIVIAGFPAAFIASFFTGSLLIEVIFSLDGLGLLGYEAAMNRDYPIVLGTLYIYALIGMALKLISDLTYVLVDPRISFEARQ